MYPSCFIGLRHLNDHLDRIPQIQKPHWTKKVKWPIYKKQGRSLSSVW